GPVDSDVLPQGLDQLPGNAAERFVGQDEEACGCGAPLSSYSVSNPCDSNFRVRQFSVTVRTVCSLAPLGSRASISSVTVTSAPGCPTRWAITSSAIRPASRPTRAGSRRAFPWNRRASCGADGAGVVPPAAPFSVRSPGTEPNPVSVFVG